MSIRRKFRNALRHDAWNIGVVAAPVAAFLDPAFRPAVNWSPPAPRGQYRADPMAIACDGGVHVFCEQYDYATDRGHIVHGVLQDDRTVTEWSPVLQPGFHVSYPNVLEHDGVVWMLPETYQDNRIALYRTDDFPSAWRIESTLVPDFPAIDPTVVYHDGRWWLFATRYADPPEYALHIWHAPTLTGPWRPHDANPVKIDPASARPAGPFFQHDSRLYRPAQDCSQRYGGALKLMEVRVLNTREYDEVEAIHVSPLANTPYRHGLHTLSSAAGVTLLDGCAHTFVWREFMRKLQRKIQ